LETISRSPNNFANFNITPFHIIKQWGKLSFNNDIDSLCAQIMLRHSKKGYSRGLEEFGRRKERLRNGPSIAEVILIFFCYFTLLTLLAAMQ
jgi:hypothetical protein